VPAAHCEGSLHILSFEHTTLSPVAFDSQVIRAEIYTRGVEGWHPTVRSEGLFIDLSLIAHADFTSLAMCALLIEKALRYGHRVRIALPLRSLRRAEIAFYERERGGGRGDFNPELAVRNQVRQRTSAYQFLEHSGFRQVLAMPHVPRAGELLEIVDNYDASSETSTEQIRRVEWAWEGPAYQRSSPAILPLRWVDPHSEDLDEWEEDACAVLLAKGLALSESHARAFARILVHELAENVGEHAPEDAGVSCAPRSLVGAIALNLSGRYQTRLNHFPSTLRPYLQKLAATDRPFVRTVVGDSGIGIPATLDRFYNVEYERMFSRIPGPLTHAEKLLYWSMMTSAKRFSGNARRGAPRGLARAERVVRNYQGALLLRSEDALVGYTYWGRARDPVIERRSSRSKRRGIRVGSVLEAFLFEPIHARGRPLVRESRAPETVGLVWRSLFDQEHGLAPLAEPTPVDGLRCIVVTMNDSTLNSDNVGAFVERLANASLDAERHGASLAVVFTSGSHEVTSVLEALDEAREDPDLQTGLEGLPDLVDPIMLVDAHGSVTWFGSTPDVRKVLFSLSESETGSLDAAALGELLERPGAGLPEELSGELPDWLSVSDDGSLGLRTLPADVDACVIDGIRARLVDAIESAETHAVRAGRFCTPGLRDVRRWIAVGDLLRMTKSRGEAAYALGRMLRQRIPHEALRDAAIVRVAGTSEDLATTFMGCLPVQSRLHSMPGETGSLLSGGDATLIPPGTRVVLLADLVLTENTIRHALADLMRHGAVPVAVCCVLDVRSERTKEVACYERNVPIVGLVEEDISLVEGVSESYINPISGEPEQPVERRVAYDLAPEVFLDKCGEDEDTLYVGHIARQNGRHFTSYINVDRIFERSSPNRDSYIEACADACASWLQDRSDGSAIELWYPRGGDEIAHRLTDMVKEQLSAEFEIGVDQVRGLRRVPTGEGWLFGHPGRDVEGGTHVIVIDWGSTTAATVHRMIGLAAEAGAASVMALIFASQLSRSDEDGLARIRSVEAIEQPTRILPPPGSQLDVSEPVLSNKAGSLTEIPVAVHFVTRLRVGMTDVARCRLCDLYEHYRAESLAAPTELLKSHAANAAELLAPLAREDVFRTRPHDLYRDMLVGRDVRDILELRQMLEDALVSTESRLALRARLESVASADRRGFAQWLRLLALEPHWLKHAPLRFAEFRSLLAQLAGAVAGGGPTEIPSESLRRQAIIVLRASSKREFFRLFPTLVAKYQDEPRLIAELFFGVYTYLKRPYHGSAPLIERALASLLEAEHLLRPEVGQDVRETLKVLRKACEDNLRNAESMEAT
jgi:adenine/guanine phosphoribosyltransferase-like PRPP-binding protein